MIPTRVSSRSSTAALRASRVAALTCALLGFCLVANAGAASFGPLAQQGPKISAESGATERLFGRSVTLSADGNTAVIGGSKGELGSGAVWVFTRTGGVWTQQGPKLTTTEETGTAHFGRTVAVSADGDTVLIGDGGDEGGRGSAWVFTRSGSTWTQQGPKLADDGESDKAHFGRSVALSGDGDTALIGGSRANGGHGAGWVFTRSGETWTEQDELTGTEAVGKDHLGGSVALSADGNTALLGGSGDAHGIARAAWVFSREGASWNQQGIKLTGSEEGGEAGFGYSVALSGDGQTALVGGPGDGLNQGAEWVFARSGGVWAQQGPKLTADAQSGESEFGYSGALSGDGDVALVGGPRYQEHAGSAWLLTRSGTSWTQQEALAGSEQSVRSRFGSSVALSSDASTALVGAPKDTVKAGAVWAFGEAVPAPPVEPVIPVAPASSSGGGAQQGLLLAPRSGVLASLTAHAVPPPVLGVSGNLEPVSGRVLVKLPGSKIYVPLTSVVQVPFGTIVDAIHGSVRVTTARLHGGTQTIIFSAGRFGLTQARNALVVAKLTGGSYAACPTKGERRGLAHASSKRKHVVRELFASGHGTYSTKGTYASGAVLGTSWLTEDLCDGTRIRVLTDKVSVTNLTTHKRRTVQAGHSFLVKAP